MAMAPSGPQLPPSSSVKSGVRLQLSMQCSRVHVLQFAKWSNRRDWPEKWLNHVVKGAVCSGLPHEARSLWWVSPCVRLSVWFKRARISYEWIQRSSVGPLNFSRAVYLHYGYLYKSPWQIIKKVFLKAQLIYIIPFQIETNEML